MPQSPPRGEKAAGSGKPSPYAREHLDQVISELIINGAIELSTADLGDIPAAARLLPRGTAVYVPKVPKRSLQENIVQLTALHQAGFDPVPHIAARQLTSARSLREFLDRAVGDAGVHRLLVIGGDISEAMGEFADSAALLASGIPAAAGIREIDVAGYPEGHPRIPLAALHSDLVAKLRIAVEQGMGVNIVTQFSFAPSRIIEYCDELAHGFPVVAVYVGLAGPANTARLIRYARHCGVSASLRALSFLGVKAAELAIHTSPDEQIEMLARYHAAHQTSNLIGVHVFSFGGFLRSAEWMQQKLRHA